MTTFSTVLDGKVITIVVVERFNPYKSEYEQEFKLHAGGAWRKITPGEAFRMLKKALEQGNTIEYYHSHYDPYFDDYVETTEPIMSIEKLEEVWY